MLKDPLFLTIILECAALLIMKEKQALFFVYWIAVTTFTNIFANLYVAYIFSGTQLQYCLTVAVIELLVFTVEFLLCLAFTKDKKKSAKYSAICNLASFGIGSIWILIITIT